MDFNLKIPAVEKLLDFAASGIGSVAGPMLASWKARREANARVIAAQGEAEAQRVLAEGQAHAMQIIAGAQADARAILISPDATVKGELDFDTAVTQRIQFQEEKRQANITAVIRQAAQELGDSEVQNGEVDHDWTARFFNNVQDVSSEEMQLLWAKVLAGEVKRLGQFSLRTLDTLRSLNVGEANLFTEACEYVAAERMIIYTDDMHVMGNNLHLGNMLKLAELGLIMWAPGLTYTAEWNRADRNMAFHRGHLSFQGLPGAISMTELPIVRLTTVGRELRNLTPPQKEVDMLYMQLLAMFLKQHRRKLSYVVGESVTGIDSWS